MSKITKGKSTNNKPETPRKDSNTINEVADLKAIVESLQSKMTTLGKKVGTLENKVEALGSTLLLSQNTSDKLSEELCKQYAELDRLHQYSPTELYYCIRNFREKKETCRDLKRSFEKNIVKDMGENSKEEFDFEYDKIYRHGKVNGTKQNVTVRFRLHQYPWDLYYTRKKIKNPNRRLKPSLAKKRTELLRNATEKIEDFNTQDIQFVYADFNGNIKIRLNEIFRERYVHTINSIEHLEEIINEISNSEN